MSLALTLEDVHNIERGIPGTTGAKAAEILRRLATLAQQQPEPVSPDEEPDVYIPTPVPVEPPRAGYADDLSRTNLDPKLVRMLRANNIHRVSAIPTTMPELVALKHIGEAYAEDILDWLESRQ